MYEDIRYRRRKAATLFTASWVVMGLVLAGLAYYEVELQGDYSPSPEVALVELELGRHYLAAMWLLIVVSILLMSWSLVESRLARNEEQRLQAGAPATPSLSEVEDLLESAKLRASKQRKEVTALEKRIAVAEQIKPQSDEELKRVRDVLGLDETARSTSRWGRAQVALALLGIAISIVLAIAFMD